MCTHLACCEIGGMVIRVPSSEKRVWRLHREPAAHVKVVEDFQAASARLQVLSLQRKRVESPRGSICSLQDTCRHHHQDVHQALCTRPAPIYRQHSMMRCDATQLSGAVRSNTLLVAPQQSACCTSAVQRVQPCRHGMLQWRQGGAGDATHRWHVIPQDGLADEQALLVVEERRLQE